MEESVIKVSGLGKRYRIGLAEERQETFALQIWHMLTAPLRNFKNLRSLSKFDKNKEDESVFWALKDINFEVQKGEVLGIIGHNGAGKSTLLKILSRITDPTEGEIEIKGRVSSLLEVGTGFHADLTGRENVYMNGTILGMSKKEIDKKFNEIAAFSGIGKYIDTPVKRYSSGMKVRLAFSVAAHLDPEILIIDEVLAVGDAEFQKKCLGKMEDVAGQGRTVLFVSHNMAAVNKLCTKAIQLFNGKINFMGETSMAVEKYLNGVKKIQSKGDISDDFERPWGNNNALFKSVKQISKNKLSNVIGYNDHLELTISLEVLSKISGCYVLIILHTLEGSRICYFDSLQSENKLYEFEKGLHEIKVSFENTLSPGSYLVSLRLMNFNTNIVHDAVDEVFEFNILSKSTDKSKSFPFKKGPASVSLNSNWKKIDKL